METNQYCLFLDQELAQFDVPLADSDIGSISGCDSFFCRLSSWQVVCVLGLASGHQGTVSWGLLYPTSNHKLALLLHVRGGSRSSGISMGGSKAGKNCTFASARRGCTCCLFDS